MCINQSARPPAGSCCFRTGPMQCHCRVGAPSGAAPPFFNGPPAGSFAKHLLPAQAASSTASGPGLDTASNRTQRRGRAPRWQACATGLVPVGALSAIVVIMAVERTKRQREPWTLPNCWPSVSEQSIGPAPLCGLPPMIRSTRRRATHQRRNAGSQNGARHGVRLS